MTISASSSAMVLRGRGLIDERSLRGSPAPRRSGRRRLRGHRRASRRGLAGRGRRASPRAGGVRALLAALERLVDGLRAGGEAALEGGEREADRALARAVELVGLAHFGLARSP